MGLVENAQDTEVRPSVLGKSLGIWGLQGLRLVYREQGNSFFSLPVKKKKKKDESLNRGRFRRIGGS